MGPNIKFCAKVIPKSEFKSTQKSAARPNIGSDTRKPSSSSSESIPVKKKIPKPVPSFLIPKNPFLNDASSDSMGTKNNKTLGSGSSSGSSSYKRVGASASTSTGPDSIKLGTSKAAGPDSRKLGASAVTGPDRRKLSASASTHPDSNRKLGASTSTGPDRNRKLGAGASINSNIHRNGGANNPGSSAISGVLVSNDSTDSVISSEELFTYEKKERQMKRKHVGAFEFEPPRKKRCQMSGCEECNSINCGLCRFCLNPHWKKRCSLRHNCPRLLANQKVVSSSKVETKKLAETNPELEFEVVVGPLFDKPPETLIRESEEDDTPDLSMFKPDDNRGDHRVDNMPTESGDNNETNTKLVKDDNKESKPEKSPETPAQDDTKNVEESSINEAVNKTLWQCSKCDKIYSQFKSFNKHVCNKRKTKMSCPSCSKLISKKFMKIHLKMHSSLKFSCSTCSCSFNSKDKLEKHQLVHNKKVYACNVCGEEYNSKSLMKAHKENLHGIGHGEECRFCGDRVKNLAALLTHLKEKHADKATFRCKLCPNVYFSKRGLRKHSKDHPVARVVEIPANGVVEVENGAEGLVPVLADEEVSYVVEIGEDISSKDLSTFAISNE